MKTKRDVKVVRKKKKRPCPFCLDKLKEINYKDEDTLWRFLTDRGKIIPRRNSSVCAKHQRKLKSMIKRARTLGFVPYKLD